jgi:predicted GNAT superfamily acetyltransferase
VDRAPATRTADAVVADAWRCARAAAQRHRIRVVELQDIGEHHAAAALLCRIWRTDSPDSVVNAGLMRAFQHSGNYVAGAYDGDTLVGTAVAFLGTGHLHSHVTGVDPVRQGGGVGFALKAHQRAWALGRGIDEVCWTFDPLVRRNAYFNLHKLGALATQYLPDFYGEMTDAINAGDATDRLYTSWRLASAPAVAAARGERLDVDVASLRARGARVLVDRAGAAPAPGHDGLPGGCRPVLVAVPADVEALRADDPVLARHWRSAVRAALTSALAAGYRITGMARDGFYVLEVAS